MLDLKNVFKNLLIVKIKEMEKEVQKFMYEVIKKNPGEPEFHQAAQEVTRSLMPFIEENPHYKYFKILERMIEPERIVIFRVP